MALHTLELQKSVIDRLKSDNDLSDLINGVYDDVPETTGYPFIVYRDISSNDFGVKDREAQELEFQVDVWSQYRGTKEAKEIMAKVHILLHNTDALSVADGALVNIKETFNTVLIDADDGITRHGVMRFRAVVFDN